MQIILSNTGGELQRWHSMTEFVDDIRRCFYIPADGDLIKFEIEPGVDLNDGYNGMRGFPSGGPR